jgi:hypothetical protein
MSSALLIIGLTVSIVLIVFVTQQAMSLATVASVQVAYAGKEPQWLTFDSLGECHQFVKDNPDLELQKKDCIRGPPPSPDPE